MHRKMMPVVHLPGGKDFFITQMSIECILFPSTVSKVRGRLQFGGLLDSFEEIEARTQDGLELPRAHTSMLCYT